MGAGRKAKDAAARALDGNAGHRGRVLPHPSSPAVPETVPVPKLDESDAPDDLKMDERQVWLELAPVAVSRGVDLSETKGLPFRILCQNVALCRRYAASVAEAGSPNHRGMIQAVDRELPRFRLVDIGGKAIAPAPKPAVDPLKEKYFAGNRYA